MDRFLAWVIIILCIALIVFQNPLLKQIKETALITISNLKWTLAVLVFGFVSLVSIFPVQHEVNKDAYRVATAFTKAKSYMLNNLKSPASAKFADEDNSGYRINKDGSITIESFVDADNSFGASIRTHFRCDVSSTGTVTNLITW